MTRSLVFLLSLSACSPSVTPAPSGPAAKLERTTLEGLTTLTLSEEAERALGLTVAQWISAPDTAGENSARTHRVVSLSGTDFSAPFRSTSH